MIGRHLFQSFMLCMNNSSTFMEWINLIFYSFLFILFGILLLTLMNYYQQQKIILTLKSFQQQYYQLNNNTTSALKTKQKRKEIHDLPHFLPIINYRTHQIDETTSPTTVDEIIAEAKQTNKFTIAPYDDKITTNKLSLHIEFIQEFRSWIIIIDIVPQGTVLFIKVHRLMRIILHSSNIIQVWNDISDILLQFEDLNCYFYDNIKDIGLFNVQEAFKTWYNKTFSHNENCDQILDYNDIDGPLCSCSHRPLKNSTEKWPLSLAIAHTFNEYLNMANNEINVCLAITKLSVIIEEKWDRQQINDYIKENH
jgi:hypothetical protein